MRICALGDRRPGVGVRADGLPDIAWMAVQPPGRRSRPFWIAKYPVTISQLGAYRGQFGGAATRTGLEGRSASWPANCSGDEAVEFCWWLMAVREYTSAIGPAAAPSSYVIRLPTEREWMAAAKGGQASSAYPWGSDWDERRAHSKSSGLPEPLAVGMFPLGDSPDGISDLAGTVWEWCANEGGTATANLRVLKGGSRLSDPLECRIDARREMRGDVSRDDRGFRICCGPDPETA